MAERDFDEGYDLDQREGHTFLLGGEKFHTIPVTTAPAYTALYENRGFAGTIAFLRKMIVEEDRESFDALLADEEKLIAAKQVDDVATWLIEVATGHPTKAPKSSRPGRGKTSE